MGNKGDRRRSYHIYRGRSITALPQKPVSKPTEKQLLSLLKAADSENGPTDSSMTWRVFMMKGRAGVGAGGQPCEATVEQVAGICRRMDDLTGTCLLGTESGVR